MTQHFKEYPANTVQGFYNSKYDKPDRNLIITGIPRSGTSLFSTLLNEIPNVYSMNEILYNIYNLPKDMAIVRYNLVNNLPVPNKYKDNKLATNTGIDKEITTEARIMDKEFDDNCVVASNVNLPYLNNIQCILTFGFKIIAVVRDPVYAIASWNMPYCKEMQIHNVMLENLYGMFWMIPMVKETNIERQAELWEWYAGIINKLFEGGKIEYIKYEDFFNPPLYILSWVAKQLDVELPNNLCTPILKNNNKDDRYPDVDIEAIREAVKEYCPIRKVFGYE